MGYPLSPTCFVGPHFLATVTIFGVDRATNGANKADRAVRPYSATELFNLFRRFELPHPVWMNFQQKTRVPFP